MFHTWNKKTEICELQNAQWELNKCDLKIWRSEQMCSGEKPNKCGQCNYSSTQASHLRSHIKTHSGEKLNRCDQCELSFARTSTLQDHKRIHSGEKPNKCDQCDFSTSRATTLKIHNRMHTGEKPYKCNDCEFVCVSSSNLHHHMKTHQRITSPGISLWKVEKNVKSWNKLKTSWKRLK